MTPTDYCVGISYNISSSHTSGYPIIRRNQQFEIRVSKGCAKDRDGRNIYIYTINDKMGILIPGVIKFGFHRAQKLIKIHNPNSKQRRIFKILKEKMDNFKKLKETYNCEGCIYHNEYILTNECLEYRKELFKE